ncbi:MAG: hypothetical protein ABMA64_12720 [Myxococcota bacterium]
MFGWLVGIAVAQTPGAGIEVAVSGTEEPGDIGVYVRADGQVYVQDELCLDSSVVSRIDAAAIGRGDQARVVVAADPITDHARVLEVLTWVGQSSVSRMALEIDLMPDPDFLNGGVESLDGKLVEVERPRRYKYPQNPYGSTDYTAYTREWGEAKIGIASTSYGVLPRMQLSTSPAMDALGAYNFSGKGNFLRVGPFDSGVSASYAIVPVTDLIKAIDPKGKYKISGYKLNNQDIFVREMSFVSFALQNSLQIAGGWSVHFGGGYLRATAVGNIDIGNIPTVVLPGFKPIGGNEVTAVPRLVGEAFDVRFATDYRFNRRDSLIFQAAATVYGTVRGTLTGDVSGVQVQGQDLENFQLALAYHQAIPMADSYRASLAWQFSWERVDARFGVGLSAVPRTWLLQAFDLSYRFGGSTRKVEAAVRRQYREGQKSQDD